MTTSLNSQLFILFQKWALEWVRD